MTEGQQPPADRPARILIVDDEPLNVDYLEQELEGHGFVTEAARDGLEALERVAAGAPDLVLLDVMMPGLDGISTLRILKEDPETRLIPVVLMTALNAVEDRVRGIEAGADDFLSKPVDERELLARIRTALRLKRAIDETVGELRSTSAHLQRYGLQERDVAVLAVTWRLVDASLPDEAIGFVGRRRREAAEEEVRARGGVSTENAGNVLVAIFDGPDRRTRTVRAVETALAVAGDGEADDAPALVSSAAVSAGTARVGSTRVGDNGESAWRFAAQGMPVQRASGLAQAATESGVFVADDTAAVVTGDFELVSATDGGYRVVGPAPDPREPARAAQVERRLATILVTDIVGSTEVVERVGDRAWIELAAEHDEATRAELRRFGGTEIDTTGDGFVVSFASPARAIECAVAVRDRVAKLGLKIRAGIHTGELEQVEGEARGISLHLASRIAARATPGEVLVSATTRELAAGAGLAFTDRGEHNLKGVVESRRLYAVADPTLRTAEPERRSRAGGYPAGLTAREVDVLRLVAVGLSDAEAAERLAVSVRTISAHLRSIYRKTGVRSRAFAGRFADENDLL